MNDSEEAGKSNGAAIAYITQVMGCGNEVIGTDHLEGVKNIHCDQLSRGTRPRALGYPSTVCHPVFRDSKVRSLLSLIDPTVEHIESDSIKLLWTSLHKVFGNEL